MLKKLIYDKLNECLYYDKLDNGLEIYLLTKPEYNKTYASFSTKYGSVDNHFKIDGKEYLMVDGIAHFLEHKLFEMPDGIDASTMLSKLGAQANAYTTFDQTTYLFTTTSNVLKAVEVLLDFVQKPYFTKDNVLKEKGIIEQEIKMYDDYPDFVSETGLLKNVYKDHPARIDIAGDVKSIRKITEEDLYTCYNAFYHPSNMKLLIIGNFNLEEVYDLIVNNQKAKTFGKSPLIERIYPSELDKVNKKYKKIKHDVSMPKLSYGIKINKEYDLMKFDMASSIYISLLLGESSKNYEDLIKSGIINESFDASSMVYSSFKLFFISTDTNNPDELIKRLNNIILSKKEFIKEDFNRIKNNLIGKIITIFNSLEAISTMFIRYSFQNDDFFKIIDLINNITLDDIYEIDNLISEDAISSFVIYPK